MASLAGGSVLGDARAFGSLLQRAKPAEEEEEEEEEPLPLLDARQGRGSAGPAAQRAARPGRPPQPPAAQPAAAERAQWVRLEDVLRSTAGAEEALRAADVDSRADATAAPVRGPRARARAHSSSSAPPR